MTPSALVDAVSPLFGKAGASWYFQPETLAAGRSLGLDGMRFYVLGRAGVLGKVDWRVVVSAFGYFSPPLIEKMWTTGMERCPLEDAVAAHLGACADYGRSALAELPAGELAAFCEAAESVVASASEDLAGLTLFAGYAAQPLPGDHQARAMHLAAVLRELRGSAHLAAVVASGLATPMAHAIRRPDAVSFFGWPEGTLPEPTDDERRLLAEADQATEIVMEKLYRGLDATAGEALLAGARAIVAAVEAGEQP